ncbi:hypothetical protein [Citrobacter werkmanii]|uniref:hypothetical protein n=1 Tax=Citrobacter werkmanii TaxID=67827 RepID=UPI00264DAB42|nr:hypothetical protein [Citrobacter werkmanii]MDN8559094.1 hypothetical protein [Citrobacter werkmanii]
MKRDASIIIHACQNIYNNTLLTQLIAERASFEIRGSHDERDMQCAVEAIERVIERHGLKFRVIDETSSAAMPPHWLVSGSGFFHTLSQIVRRHLFSGYRLSKSVNSLSVIWQP